MRAILQWMYCSECKTTIYTKYGAQNACPYCTWHSNYALLSEPKDCHDEEIDLVSHAVASGKFAKLLREYEE